MMTNTSAYLFSKARFPQQAQLLTDVGAGKAELVTAYLAR